MRPLLVAGALLAALAAAAAAAPPLDPAYGEGGIAAAGAPGEVAVDGAADPRGRVLVASGAGGGAAVVRRLTARGEDDRGWAQGAAATVAGLAPTAITAGRDGGAVVGGSGEVVRLTGTGALHRRFGRGGRARVRGTVTGIAVTREGSVAVAGALADGTFELALLRPDGRPDRRFGGGDGRLAIPGRALAPVPVPGGRLVLAYQATQDDGLIRVGTIRLDRRGVPDGTYGARGVRRIALAGARRLAGVAVDPRGRVVVAVTLASGRTAIARLTGRGNPDRRFGRSGSAELPTAAAFEVAGVATTTAGAVLAGGTAQAGGAARPAVARLTRTGRPDARFGTGGLALADPAQIFTPVAFTVAAGRAVLVGQGERPLAGRFSAAGR